MHSWILLIALFSLTLVAAKAKEDAEASIATQNDDRLSVEDSTDEEDSSLDKVSFDAQMEAPSGFNLTIPRKAVIAARKLSVSIPLLLPGNGINTLYRHSYCFRRLSYFPSRNGFRGWRILNLVGYVVSGRNLYVFWRCDRRLI